MGKTLATIINVLTSPIGLIDKDIGNAVRVIGFTIIGNILLPGFGGAIGASIATALNGAVNALSAPKAQAPPQASISIKDPIPPRVKAYGTSRLFGASMLFETAPTGTSVDVYAFADGRADGLVQAYLNDDKVTIVGDTVSTLADKSYQGGRVKVGFNYGLATETAFSAVIAQLPGIWTSGHRGDGIVSGYLLKAPEKDKYFLETYPQGDSVKLSVVMRWQWVFDPRDGGQDPYDPSTWAWSDNAALAFVHYMMAERGYDWDRRFEPQRTLIEAAADVCDAAMTLSAGGTEARYRTSVAYHSNEEPASIITALLACFDGWYCLNELGEVMLFAGEYYEPTIDIGPDQVVAFSHQRQVENENRVNVVTVNYVSALHDYTTVDAQAWTDDDDIAARGEENPVSLGAQIPSFTQGRRLAKRLMSRNNAPNRGRTTTTFGGRVVLGQRFINLHIEEAGAVFYDGPAEIVGTPERDPSTGGVTFDWVAADPNIDAWNPDTEDGEGAAVGDRVAKEPLGAPTITDAIALYSESTDSGTGVRIQVSATGDDLAATSWFLRWRKDSSSVWNEQAFADLDPGPDVELLSGFVPVTSGIDVEVEYRVADGRLSGWSSATTVDTRTSTTVPDDADSITLISWSDTLSLSTGRIARASTYRWRFYDPGDLTTPIRTIVTTPPAVAYARAQAATDGARRDYVVTVAGVNGAGAGAVASSSTITLAAPSTVTGFSAADGAYESEVDFDLSTDIGVAGYTVAISTASGFDPFTQGTLFRFNGSPAFLQNLAAGSFYAKMAAFDVWTDRPDLLNFTTEDTFTISTGGGGTGGGGGDGGGGYCVAVDTLILMADGSEKAAGDLEIGDVVHTQHETSLEWGDHAVEAIALVEADVFALDIGAGILRATAGHRMMISGSWITMEALGTPAGTAMVARITVADAHTYVSGGVLSHNIKPFNPDIP